MENVIADVRGMNSASILDLIVVMIISSTSIMEFFNSLGQGVTEKNCNRRISLIRQLFRKSELRIDATIEMREYFDWKLSTFCRV